MAGLSAAGSGAGGFAAGGPGSAASGSVEPAFGSARAASFGAAGVLTSSGATASALSAARRSIIAPPPTATHRRCPRSRPRARRFCGLWHPPAATGLRPRIGCRAARRRKSAIQPIAAAAGSSCRWPEYRTRSSARAVAPPSSAAISFGSPSTGAIDTPALSGTANSSAGGRSSANGCGSGWHEASSAIQTRAAGRTRPERPSGIRPNAVKASHKSREGRADRRHRT